MAVIILVSLAVLVEWLCLFGLVVMRNPYDRLHAIGPANILPPVLIVIAVLLDTGFTANSAKVVAIGVVILITGPLLTHAIARAARVEEKGTLAPSDK